MILSGEKIKQCVQEGTFSIEPFNVANLKGASYTFTLDSRVLCIEGEQGVLRTDVKPNYTEHHISDTGYVLDPGQFILGFTKEKLKLNNRYACILSARGSCAQIGLSVLLGSHFAEPDTDNKQTLEIANIGRYPILLFSGMLIVKGIFMTIDE